MIIGFLVLIGCPISYDVILEAIDLHLDYGSEWRDATSGGAISSSPITFDLRRGEIMGLMGGAASGKTLLAETLVGSRRERSGTILLEGQDVSGVPSAVARRKRGEIEYVGATLRAEFDPELSVERVLLQAQNSAGLSNQRFWSFDINHVFHGLGFHHRIRKFFCYELSESQLRLVALARSILLYPKILVLNDPFSGFEVNRQREVLAGLKICAKGTDLHCCS